MKILLAEDNKINQKYIVGVLGKTNHTVDVVENGHQAVNAVRRSDYEVVLMDVQMPDLDGEQATKQIRALPSAKRDVLIIALTAHAMTGAREKCLAAGMNDYLSKPISSAVLIAKLDSIAGSTVVAFEGAPAAVPGQTFDIARLEALRDILSPSAFSEQLSLLIETFAPAVERIGAYLQEGNLKYGASEAHDLAGIAGSYGAVRVSELASELEAACRSLDSGGAADRFAELKPAAQEASLNFDRAARVRN